MGPGANGNQGQHHGHLRHYIGALAPITGTPPPGSRTAGEAGLPGAIRPDEPYWQINLREHWAFKLGSWRRALDTIDVDQFEPTNPLLKTNCAWILEGGWKTTRCQRLCVAILNNFRSEFGDMNIVVGDPTGQIRCVVHKDVVKADSDAIQRQSEHYTGENLNKMFQVERNLSVFKN